MTSFVPDAILVPSKIDLEISYDYYLDGKAVTHVLHIFVTEEQFKQYNQLLGRVVS